jgi:hypothetical protein
MAQGGYAVAGTPPLVGGPTNAPAPIQQNQRVTPFRQATLEKREQILTDTGTLSTSYQPIVSTIHGSGYIYSFSIEVIATTSGNSANVAYQEDAAFAHNALVMFKDVTGPLVQMGGFDLYWMSKYGGWTLYLDSNSADTALYQKVTGTGGTGGTYHYHLQVPISTSRRNLLALLGNQDRSQSYELRRDVAPSTAVYSTGPTSQPTFVQNIQYVSYAVPMPQNPDGSANEIQNSTFGTLHFLEESVNPTPPAAGTVNHYLNGLGNTIRLLMLVVRSNSSRTTAESYMPTNIQFKVANQTLFNESYGQRRKVMWDRYGYDAPAGTIVYDTISDFQNRAGSELGHDYWWTQQVNEAQFIMTYPSGIGSTANSLTVVKSDLSVPGGIDVVGQ